ncbi:hypothetical protein ACGFIV_27145 [Sphaerisporangium sp. NPDC049003]|uniref:hypothetical protein n=1 Tax=Sphaerisporangium sp. NPDC049003 TaxID=3364517 RepID=UPI003722E112
MGALHQTLTDLVTPGEQELLRSEALRLRASADTRIRRDPKLVDDAQLTSPASGWYTSGGDVRWDLHQRTLVDRLGGMLGRSVQAVVSSYLYYGRGDFIGLHTDQGACQLTVLVLLDGTAGPLWVHPELCGLSAAELLQHTREHGVCPPGGVAVDLGDGPTLLHGQLLPHHRSPHEDDREIALAAFCYETAAD